MIMVLRDSIAIQPDAEEAAVSFEASPSNSHVIPGIIKHRVGAPGRRPPSKKLLTDGPKLDESLKQAEENQDLEEKY